MFLFLYNWKPKRATSTDKDNDTKQPLPPSLLTTDQSEEKDKEKDTHSPASAKRPTEVKKIELNGNPTDTFSIRLLRSIYGVGPTDTEQGLFASGISVLLSSLKHQRARKRSRLRKSMKTTGWSSSSGAPDVGYSITYKLSFRSPLTFYT